MPEALASSSNVIFIRAQYLYLDRFWHLFDLAVFYRLLPAFVQI